MRSSPGFVAEGPSGPITGLPCASSTSRSARGIGLPRRKPLDAHQFLELVPDLTMRDVFVCGTAGFMRSLLDAARDAGVPERQLHHEDYGF